MRINLRKKSLKQKKALKTLDFLNLIMILKLRIEKVFRTVRKTKIQQNIPLIGKKEPESSVRLSFFDKTVKKISKIRELAHLLL